MSFTSDTSAPAHPACLEAMTAANQGAAPSYGSDGEMKALRDQLAETFATEAFEAWPVASGTAANALALSVLCPPTGAVLCHREAHIANDERGAPEFFTGGGKLQLLDGPSGKLMPDTLDAIDPGFVHATPGHVLSLTNLTECGTAYAVEELARQMEQARDHGLWTHLDGARLANALVATGQTPAAMTWQAGVDVLTLGLTKTGALGCEIILLFGRARRLFPDLRARTKRAGHMPPKMRYLAAQGRALLANDLWLELARTANTRARALSGALCRYPGVTLCHPVDGNEVFARLPAPLVQRLKEAGIGFIPWGDGSYRFVCSWTTTQEDVDTVAAL